MDRRFGFPTFYTTMGPLFPSVFVILLGLCYFSEGVLVYPKSYRDEGSTGDVYNGVKVEEPYKWMYRKSNASDLRRYVGEQAAVTRDYVGGCKSRAKFVEMLTKAETTPKYSNAWNLGGRYAYVKQDGPDSTTPWYIQDAFGSPPRRLSLSGTLSRDGKLLADFDPEKRELYIRNISGTNEGILVEIVSIDQESLHHTEFDWAPDTSGFFYVLRKTVEVEDIDGETEEERTLYYLKFHKIRQPEKKRDAVLVSPGDGVFCGTNTSNCILDEITISNDGQYLLVTSNSKVDASRYYFYNLLKLNPKNPASGFVVIPVKHWVESSTKQLHLIAHYEEKLYILNEIEKPEVISPVTVVPPAGLEGGITYSLLWRNATLTASETGNIYDAIVVGKDKLLVGYHNEGDANNSTVILHSLKDGSVLKKFPVKYQQTWWFSGRPDESEILFVISIIDQLSEIYAFNASQPESDLKPFKTQEMKTELDLLIYHSNLVNDTVHNVTIIRKKDFKKNGTAPAFIFLDAESIFSPKNLAFIDNYEGIIVVHEQLEDTYPFHHKPFFSDAVEMTQNAQNVVDLIDALIKERYTSKGMVILVGYEVNVALAANVVNQRADSIAAVLLSKPHSNLRPFGGGNNEHDLLCPDGYYGDVCAHLNSVLFPIVDSVTPFRHLPSNSSSYPLTVLQVHPNLYKTSSYRPEIHGIEYLSVLQHTYGNNSSGVDNKNGPFLLVLTPEANSGEYEENGKFTEWEDLLCALEKSGRLSPTI